MTLPKSRNASNRFSSVLDRRISSSETSRDSPTLAHTVRLKTMSDPATFPKRQRPRIRITGTAIKAHATARTKLIRAAVPVIPRHGDRITINLQKYRPLREGHHRIRDFNRPWKLKLNFELGRRLEFPTVPADRDLSAWRDEVNGFHARQSAVGPAEKQPTAKTPA
jgi:hypothetical protein